jgi:GGDEF domain-containing protein
MISIQSSLTDLELSHQIRAAILECYVQAVKDVGHYALELEEATTRQFRTHLTNLAEEISGGSPEVLPNSRANLRALLRDYRDKGTAYVASLRDDLAATARSLEEILDSLAQSDGDHETRLRLSLSKLRMIAASPEGAALRDAVSGAADSIEQSIEQMRKQHQLTVSQFQAEIRVLHKRIDSLETAVSKDQLTRLANRAELTERIQATPPGEYVLVLIVAKGLLRAEVQFGKEVAQELAASFAKRLRNTLPFASVAGRWDAEEFAVMASIRKQEAMKLGKWITENLSGSYSCLKEGKSVRPGLQCSVGIVETAAADAAERVLQRIDLFFGGPAGRG